MRPIRTLLCAVDFSDDSRRALRVALQLASRLDAAVLALHVVDFLLAQAAAAAYSEKQLRDDARRELEIFVKEARGEAADRRLETAVTVGPPERRICEYAQERSVDLIVIGSHGLGGIRKAFMGSVAEKVLRGTEVPVLTVRASGAEGFESIVAAVALDEASPHVARYAAGLAERLGLALTLLHVVTPLSAFPQYTSALEAAERARQEEAERALAALASTLPSNGPVRTAVRTGRAPEEIAEFAQGASSLVVIGLGGRRLLHRPGSTAYRVFSLSQAPVLAVPESPETRN